MWLGKSSSSSSLPSTPDCSAYRSLPNCLNLYNGDTQGKLVHFPNSFKKLLCNERNVKNFKELISSKENKHKIKE